MKGSNLKLKLSYNSLRKTYFFDIILCPTMSPRILRCKVEDLRGDTVSWYHGVTVFAGLNYVTSTEFVACHLVQKYVIRILI